MHRSRLCGFIIDCRSDDLARDARFWSEALGLAAKAPDGEYIPLDASEQNLTIELQRVDHPSRVHLDIESDDVEAEVARLERLGARRIEKVKTWWVMEAPSGHRFCVVEVQNRDFHARANQWA